MAQIEELVGAGRLVPVRVSPPPPEVFVSGDARSRDVYGKPLCHWTCEDNSRRVVEAMYALGERDWAVVGGYAFGRNPAFPAAHVWVRKGDLHLDPSWSRIDGEILSLDKFSYFALPQVLPSTAGLDHLRLLARGWGLEILDDHPEVAWDEDSSS